MVSWHAGPMGQGVLIVNPFASKVTDERVRLVQELLPGTPDVRLTQARGHATELARDAIAEGAEAIYVFSGDGGFNEVLNGVDGSVPVGFLPGGGTSVLPRALGLPRHPLVAARAIARGETRRIALGRVNGRRFAFNAGIGFDAEVVRRVDSRGRRADGRRPGDLIFAWTVARAIAARRARYDTALEVVGLGRAAFALVANCDPYTYAGGFALHVARDARFELGLDVVAPRSVRARDLPGFVLHVVRGTKPGRDVLVGHDLDELEIRCDVPMPLQVDGEDLGDVTEALFAAERDAVTVFV
jgi:diacylglycerol kinase family enzyme